MFRIGLNYSIFAFIYISQNEQFVNITNNHKDIYKMKTSSK